MKSKPNIILILADDMGFSDIGCYGSEIDTPHIDRLAAGGVRFSQFYNTARCSPSRASMLTGLHPHQTGIGILTQDDRPHGYPGSLNESCITLAEILSASGYATSLVGKWHMASNIRQVNDAWPTKRGFSHFYGTLAGSCSYYQPATLTRGEKNAETEASEQPNYYYTDAISQEACHFVRNQSKANKPFFMYMAYTAPHWPLHAREEDIAKYRGRYDEGWDVLRERRFKRLLESGLLKDSVKECERDPNELAWVDAENKEWEARRMEVYAAQIHRMDQGIGDLLTTLEKTDQLENTLIFFLSDNGACAEVLPLDDSADAFLKRRSDLIRLKPKNGCDLQVGNEPSIVPGPEDTYASYGRAWANMSNTPFRLYKRWTHEGGISTPLIVSWPSGDLAIGSIVRSPHQLTDVLPTILEAVQLQYPEKYKNREITKCEGQSFLSALRGRETSDHPLFWEHTGNAAMRLGRWKLVREYPNPWELYDMETDRAETINLATTNPNVLNHLVSQWDDWANRVGVKIWDNVLIGYRNEGKSEKEAAG
jgi:arylsulfatase